MRAVLLLAGLVLLPAAAPPPPVPVYRSFGRWFVACDNVRSCEARGFDEVTRADLRVTRDAGAAPPFLLLTAEDPLDVSALRLDGAPLDLPAAVWKADAPSQSSLGTLSISDPKAIAAFIAAARNAHALTLEAAPASADKDRRQIPLDGLTAALLLMDAVQGRPGTQTPLIAPAGTGAPPPAPPLPRAPVWVRPPPLTAAETRAIIAGARSLSSPEFDTCTVDQPTTVAALDATHALAIRPCYMAAYQGSSLVEVFPRRGGAPVPVNLALPGLPRDDRQGPDMVDPDFNSKTGTLSTAAKGRGLADCGMSVSWVWSAGAFRLINLVFDDQCGGAEPGDWPTLFRTKPIHH